MTKLVSLSNEAYSTLYKMKAKDMSFSQIILKLVTISRPKRNFLKFAGMLKSQSKDLEQFKKQLNTDRQRNINVGD